MTVEYLREILQHGNGHLTKSQLDEAFLLFSTDAENECLYIPDFMDMCYMLLRESMGELADAWVHRCANAYITNIELKHPEQEDMLYFLYYREAEYYARHQRGAETIYYAGRILQLEHVQPQFYTTALLYIHTALLAAELPVYHEHYTSLLHKLTSSPRQDASNMLLTVSLMDICSQLGDLSRYLQARADTEKLLSSLPREHELRSTIQLHLITTAFSFPELISKKTAPEQLEDLRRCLELLNEGTAAAVMVNTILTPMLNSIRKLMPLNEFVDSVRQIIALLPGDHDRMELYIYLTDECGVTAEDFPELFADYFQALRADWRFRKVMDRRAIEINLLQNDLHIRYKAAALTDKLTGLMSRYAYQNDLSLLKADENLAVLVVDVNRLKYINDTFGHEAGDTALVQAANWLTECFAGLGKIYRYGGDEFFIITHSGEDSVRAAVEKLRLLSAQPSGGDYSVALSVGCAFMRESTCENVEELMQLADSRMYTDKNAYYVRTGLERRRSARPSQV